MRRNSAAAIGADEEVTGVALSIAFGVSVRQLGIDHDVMGIEQLAKEGEIVAALAVGEEAVVANPVEAIRQGMQQETADELVGIERHQFGLAVLAIVFPGEADLAIKERDQPAVGDGDAMGVAAEITQHLFGATERRLGIDDPFDVPELVEPGGKGRGLGETGEVAEEAQLAGIECILQVLEEQSTKQTREHAHGQEEAGSASDPACAVERGAAAWDHAMNVRMVLQGLTPQVWSTAVTPICAPRCLGSAAMVVSASAAARNRIA
jgi:hypothetical protein